MVFSVVNLFVKPLLVFLTLPFTLVTLGIFYLIVNAAMFALAAAFVSGFTVSGFWSALLGALAMSLLGIALNRDKSVKVKFSRRDGKKEE